jgi:NAD(P)-dependent dehydrogenase (short-subunit alcohol dehydrogenase family)
MSASNERGAMVAGAGGELGRATAEKPAAAGFTTVGVDRSEDGLRQLPDSIRRETADPADPARGPEASSIGSPPGRPAARDPGERRRAGRDRRHHRLPVSGAAAPVSGAVVLACGA